MDRRRFLLTSLAGALAAPLPAKAQQARKAWRIGFLFPGVPALGTARLTLLQQGLRDLGYVVGQNVTFEARWAEGDAERLAQYAAELARLKVDIIVTAALPAARAAKAATRTIPIVMIDPGDPVATGLVASLARPSGNATGLTSIAPDLAGKHVQLLREVLPHASVVVFLYNAANRDAAVALREMQAVGDPIGVRTDAVPIEAAVGIEGALEEVGRRRPQALVIYPDPLTFTHRGRLGDFAAGLGIMSMSAAAEFVHAGIILSYGPSFPKLFRDAAVYIDKILRGSRPGDLPVEQPTKLELVINLKTAKALGLTIPASMLLRADHVIE
jgi:putative ABC transport system substrate-binding protein